MIESQEQKVKNDRLTIPTRLPNPRSLLYFLSPQQEEEPTDLEMIMKKLIQSKNNFFPICQ